MSNSKFSILVRLAMHLGLLAMYSYTWHFTIFIVPANRRKFPWYYYLTMWNFLIQTVYNLVAIAQSSVELLSGREIVQKSKLDDLMAHIITPLTSFVVAVFWSIFLYEESLMVREDAILPPWLNYIVHGYVLLLPGVEFFFLPRPAFSMKRAVLAVGFLGVLYLSFLEYKLITENVAFYPFYKLMTFDQRIVLNIFFLSIVAPLCCWASYTLRNTIHIIKEQSKEKFN